MENNLKDQHYKNMDIMLQMDTLAFEAESVAYVVCGRRMENDLSRSNVLLSV